MSDYRYPPLSTTTMSLKSKAIIAAGLILSVSSLACAQTKAPPSDQAALADAAARNAAQNPVAPAISVPLQNNTYYGVGPYRRAENLLVAEPVIPIKLSKNWAVITRTIIPIEVSPRLAPSLGSDYGLGNIQPQFYLTPVHPGKIFWGAGPQLYMPTATDSILGTNKWGGGPAGAILSSKGHWLGGLLFSNQFAGLHHKHVNELTLNPFLFYNLPGGWYLFTSPVITADWTAARSDRWTAPVGGGVGRVFKIRQQAINSRTQFLNTVCTTNGGPDWQVQTQVQFIFPVKK